MVEKECFLQSPPEREDDFILRAQATPVRAYSIIKVFCAAFSQKSGRGQGRAALVAARRQRNTPVKKTILVKFRAHTPNPLRKKGKGTHPVKPRRAT
jgi:hypothetical protein